MHYRVQSIRELAPKIWALVPEHIKERPSINLAKGVYNRGSLMVVRADCVSNIYLDWDACDLVYVNLTLYKIKPTNSL